MSASGNLVLVKTWPVLSPELDLIGRARGYICRRCGSTRILGKVPLVYAIERARIHARRCVDADPVAAFRRQTGLSLVDMRSLDGATLRPPGPHSLPAGVGLRPDLLWRLRWRPGSEGPSQ